MRFTSLNIEGQEQAAIVTSEGYISIKELTKAFQKTWSIELFSLLENNELKALQHEFDHISPEQLNRLPVIPYKEGNIAPLYRHPRKIFGIGMNYWKKAEDLGATPPDQEPILFMKPDTSLIGPNENIILPHISNHVTSEAELGIVIGKTCKDVSIIDALDYVAGFVPTLDMTAQDIHAKNPRFLGRSKIMDTFFSFGPELITLDEYDNLDEIAIETVLNGEVIHRSTVSHMIYSLPFLVSYFSQMMTLCPGDIIMTGTPGSVPLKSGDIASCCISGLTILSNPVVEENDR